MFNFLRKLRLRENRFSRYLVYAFGEILLVVVGILIAVQVNDWNNERKLAKEEKTILRSIISEFSENKFTLKQSMQRAEKRADDCLKLLEYIGPELPNIKRRNSDSLIIFGLNNHVTVELSDAYLRDLLATGKIHILQDDSLKYLLANWEKYVEEVKEDESELFDEKSTLIKPFLIEHYSFAHFWASKAYNYETEFEFDYREIYTNRSFEGLVISKTQQYRRIKRGYDYLDEIIDQILNRAREDLKTE